MIMKRG